MKYKKKFQRLFKTSLKAHHSKDLSQKEKKLILEVFLEDKIMTIQLIFHQQLLKVLVEAEEENLIEVIIMVIVIKVDIKEIEIKKDKILKEEREEEILIEIEILEIEIEISEIELETKEKEIGTMKEKIITENLTTEKIEILITKDKMGKNKQTFKEAEILKYNNKIEQETMKEKILEKKEILIETLKIKDMNKKVKIMKEVIEGIPNQEVLIEAEEEEI